MQVSISSNARNVVEYYFLSTKSYFLKESNVQVCYSMREPWQEVRLGMQGQSQCSGCKLSR